MGASAARKQIRLARFSTRGHSHLSTTGGYLEAINSGEIISTVRARRTPMMRASAGLSL